MTHTTEARLLFTVVALSLTTSVALWVHGSFSSEDLLVARSTVDEERIETLPFPQQRIELTAMANRVVERDPFRADRAAAPMPFSHVAEGMPAPPPEPPAPPKPSLVLRGTVGGPEWEALLEGVPGREASVLVRQGDTLAGLRVRRTARDTVEITGMDTTWTLTVRSAWP
jgi:hypothetical protein